MRAVQAISESIEFNELGMPDHNRRLADKILAAFNHAYAIGEVDVAQSLRKALIDIERSAGMDDAERRTGRPTLQADLWVAYVETRNRYKATIAGRASDAGGIEAALLRMRAAYKRWSAA